MYFKQIEIIGFKSFADRTVINLEAGMTAIVGPNGCGKSNILDAMRWALGEQSAKALRGSHMQDVIFNGSEERAATGMAEVSLTFDNADSALPLDFSEVRVTRRIYRSGESEYLINKAPCRLRDIQELFMDTGIGTNAYSMIGQGKISLVLSSKPEDRRFLFEEAAGIIKYKSRKRVAMRKLDQAEQNLLRLGDIIAEVQRQVRSLKRQVNAAIRYRELKEELRHLEVRSAWLKYQHLFEQVGLLSRQFSETQDAYEKDNAEMSALEGRFEELSLTKLEVDRVLHARREGVHEIDVEMEKIERQIALIRQQISFSHEQSKRADEERKGFEDQAARAAAEQESSQGRIVSLKEEGEELRGEMEAKQSEHEESVGRVAETEEGLEAVRGKVSEARTVMAQTETAIERLAANIDSLDGQLKALYERQSADNARREELGTELEQLQRSDNEKEARLRDLESRSHDASEKQASLSKAIGDVQTAWQELREQKSSQEARLKSLRELRDSYEGFVAGVRAVMGAKQDADVRVDGIIGPVGDLVSTDQKYERAIEAALGSNIHNVVVNSSRDLKSAIDFLTGEQLGRVTFLPLDGMRSQAAGEMSDKPGVLCRALDAVLFDEGVRPAVEHVLSNTLIVENLEQAIAISENAESGPRLVTMQGEVVEPSGAVTGGRTRHESRGLLGRSAEIDELEQTVQSLSEAIEAKAAQSAELSGALGQAKADLEGLEEQTKAVQGERNEIGVAVARNGAELASLTEAADMLNGQRLVLTETRDGLEAERMAAIERGQAMESEDAFLQQALAEAQDGASGARQTQSVCASALSDLRVKHSSLSHTIEETEREKVRQTREEEQARTEVQRRADAIVRLVDNCSVLENDIEDHIERSKALSESKEEGRKKVVEVENQRQKILDESDVLEKKLHSVRDKSRESQAAIHRIEIDLRHDEDQLEFFQERILTEYNIVLGSLSAEEVGADEHEDKVRDKMVKDIRTRLDRMGSVNLTAIEEYETLCERDDFLVGQEQDLRKARETLLNVVARIDTTICAMFLETFNEICDSFRQYFRLLFNGGQARIYLLDEDDPLESGIEIEARPPGKKLQSISLLSGGEQAMTAIALLFSIFKAKPSPFCVLDEVDAPLDDANIGRFLNVLDDFAGQSQFVVITHNKQTMARADALYGVTMQERGVSQLVSVRLDEVRQEAEPAA